MHRKLWVLAVICFFAVAGFALSAGATDDKGMASKDKDFVRMAASGGMMEVQAGKLAQQKASSQDVKKFGAQMETDHTKFNDELKNLLVQKRLTVPKEMERKHISTMKKLEKATGPEFDKTYMEAMVKDHKDDIEDFRKASQKVKDPEVKAWIDKTLPKLEEHLKMAKETAAKVGVDKKKLDK